MMIKVAVSDCFKLKMIPSFRSVFFPEKQEIHYIGGTDILPLPLSSEEEGHAISLLGGGQDEEGKKLLIEHNLRLVVYIAKKFDNTGVGVEDLISIGTIGLIKAVMTYDSKKGNRLAAYAAALDAAHHVELAGGLGQLQGLAHNQLQGVEAEELVDIPVVNGDGAGAGVEPDAGNGLFPSAGTVKIRSAFVHNR